MTLLPLPMEGKLHAVGLQTMDADDDLLTAMARDLVTRQGVGDDAADVWKNLVAQHRGPAVAVEIQVQEPDLIESVPWIRPTGPMIQLSLF